MAAIVMQGCSGSTWVTGTAVKLLKCAAGWNVIGDDYEHGINGSMERFKADQNPWFQQVMREAGVVREYYTTVNGRERYNFSSAVDARWGEHTLRDLWREALQRMQRYALSRCATLLLQPMQPCSCEDPVMSMPELLHGVSMTFAHVWRHNTLDVTVCRVRDCFDTDAGWPTYRGAPSRLCFARRKSVNDEMQYHAHLRVVNYSLAAHLEANTHSIAKFHALMQRDGLIGRTAPLLEFEKLASVQYADAAATGEFAEGAAQWLMLARLLGANVTYGAIEECLHRIVRPHARPGPHAHVIENLDEVRAALCDVGHRAPLCALVREREGQAGEGEGMGKDASETTEVNASAPLHWTQRNTHKSD